MTVASDTPGAVPAAARTAHEIELLRGPFAAVMDTNVGLDLYSRHDLAGAAAIYEARRHGDPAKAEKARGQVQYRMKRTRYAWWLVMALEHARLNTLGFTTEFSRIFHDRVPYGSEHAPWSAAIKDFVKVTVAPHWTPVTSDRDMSVSKSDADLLLVTMAKEHSLPIITCEEDGHVAQAAAIEGVEIFLPEEFIKKLSLPFEDARRLFFERINQRVGPYATELAEKSGVDRATCRKALMNIREEFIAIWDWTPGI